MFCRLLGDFWFSTFSNSHYNQWMPQLRPRLTFDILTMDWESVFLPLVCLFYKQQRRLRSIRHQLDWSKMYIYFFVEYYWHDSWPASFCDVVFSTLWDMFDPSLPFPLHTYCVAVILQKLLALDEWHDWNVWNLTPCICKQTVSVCFCLSNRADRWLPPNPMLGRNKSTFFISSESEMSVLHPPCVILLTYEHSESAHLHQIQSLEHCVLYFVSRDKPPHNNSWIESTVHRIGALMHLLSFTVMTTHHHHSCHRQRKRCVFPFNVF